MSFILIAIELIFVTIGRSFKETGSVLFVIVDSWDKDFLNPITSVYICIPGWCYGCVQSLLQVIINKLFNQSVKQSFKVTYHGVVKKYNM